jgi:hypothetical protein
MSLSRRSLITQLTSALWRGRRSVWRFTVFTGALAFASGCHDMVGPAPSAVSRVSRSLALPPTADSSVPFYGPQQFSRTKGAPDQYAEVLSTRGYTAPFILYVQNGDGSGGSAVSSGHVSLGGVVLLGPSDFSKNASGWNIPVTVGDTATLQVELEGKPGTYVVISLVGLQHARFCPTATGDGFGFQTLQNAIDSVSANHTIWVCDGAHAVNEALVTKPLIIRAEHAGQATLVQPSTAAAGNAILDVNGTTSGTNAIVDLALQVTQVGVYLHGSFDQVSVLRDAFAGPTCAAAPLGGNTTSIDVYSQATTVATAHVVVDSSTFTNVCVGINSTQPVNFDTFNSTFTNIAGSFGIIYESATGGQDPSPTGVSLTRTGRIIGNSFLNCGAGACLAEEEAGVDTIAQNQIVLTAGHTNDGIFVNRTGEAAGLTRPAVITDNVIQGYALTGSASVSTSWAFTNGIVENAGVVGVSDMIQRNHVSGAYMALVARVSTYFMASDNTVDNSYVALVAAANSIVAAQRNDFTNYSYAVSGLVSGAGIVSTPALSAGSATCNWWGSAGGPVNVPSGVSFTVYTPYSTVPIAGQPSVTCNPNAIATTIRACPTPSSNGVPTVATVQLAYAAVPNGGTVLVCDGSFVVSDLQIAKSVTITAEGPGMPTIDAGSGDVAFALLHIATGPLTISKLHFTDGLQGQIAVRAVASTRDGAITNITQNVFDAPHLVNPSGGAAAAAIYLSSLDSATITIDSNTFNGGDGGIATSTTPGVHVTIQWNTFTGQTAQALAVSNLDPSASYDIEHNVFVDCATNGTGSCVSSISHATIANNMFTVHIASPTSAAISLGIQNGDLGVSTITNNTILGIGSGSTDRTQPSAYAFPATAIWLSNAVAVVSGNYITNAYEGIRITNVSAVTATDNVIQTTYAVWRGYGNGGTVLTANWNDMSDYIVAFNQAQEFTLSAMNIRCNWWGQAAGPTQMDPIVPVSAFTPFAVAPVAGQSHAGCTP